MELEDPIAHLLEEHKEFLFELEKLRTAASLLKSEGQGESSKALPAFQEIARMMADRLVRHSRKEDDVLFPAMEQTFGGGGAGLPTSVMRDEHTAIQRQSGFLSLTIQRLIQVEHEAIEVNSKEFMDMSVAGKSASELVSAVEEFAQLLQTHFAKEEQMLFPMARNALDAEALRRVAERFREIG